MSNKCHFPDCDKPIFVKKTSVGPCCNGHYAQYKKGKKKLTPLRGYKPRVLLDGDSLCPIKDCNRPSWHKTGFCQSHKKQDPPLNGMEYTKIREYTFQDGVECKITGCPNPTKSRGYCATHYRKDWGACTHPGCTKGMYNKTTGLCASHYKKNGDK